MIDYFSLVAALFVLLGFKPDKKKRGNIADSFSF